MFARSVAVDAWNHVTVHSHQRDELVKLLRERGVRKINGVTPEQFVRTSAMPVPNSDGSGIEWEPGFGPPQPEAAPAPGGDVGAVASPAAPI